MIKIIILVDISFDMVYFLIIKLEKKMLVALSRVQTDQQWITWYEGTQLTLLTLLCLYWIDHRLSNACVEPRNTFLWLFWSHITQKIILHLRHEYRIKWVRNMWILAAHPISIYLSKHKIFLMRKFKIVNIVKSLWISQKRRVWSLDHYIELWIWTRRLITGDRRPETWPELITDQWSGADLTSPDQSYDTYDQEMMSYDTCDDGDTRNISDDITLLTFSAGHILTFLCCVQTSCCVIN